MTKNALTFLPAKILEGLMMMFMTSLYAAIFSPEAYGTFLFTNTNVLTIYLVGFSWLTNASSRYVGDEVNANNESQIFSTYTVIGFAVFSAIFIFCAILWFKTGDSIYIYFSIMYFAYSLFQSLNSILIQLEKTKVSVILSLSSVSLKLLVAYALVYLNSNISSMSTPAPALIAAISGDLLSGIIAFIYLKIPKYFSIKSFSKNLFNKMLKFGIPLLGVSVCIGALNMVDRYVVDAIFGKEVFAFYTGNYSIVSGVFGMINIAIMRAVYPALLSGYRTNGFEAAQITINKGVRLYLLIAVPAALGISGISSTLSQFIFIDKLYHNFSYMISLTAIALVIFGLTEYANKAFELTSKTMPIVKNSFIAAIFKVLLSIILAYALGVYGVALATIISFLIYFILTYSRAKSIFIFQINIKSVLKILFSGILCFISAFLICQINFNTILIKLILAVFTGGAVYAISLLLSGEIKDEITAIRSAIGKN